MEDYSSNEKVKHEKQRRNIMYNVTGSGKTGHLAQ